ncbi:MAG: hypothetical protein LBT75_03530 [Bacilli bacterium]|jgi:hypothetical protein|nr:hypothetical protein [Bacilli bacterium]
MSKADYLLVVCLTIASIPMASFKLGDFSLELVPCFLVLFIFRDLKASLIGSLSYFIIALVNNFPLGIISNFSSAILIFVILYIGAILLNKVNIVTCIGFVFISLCYILPFMIFLDTPFKESIYLDTVGLSTVKTALNLGITALASPLIIRYLKSKNVIS